MNVRFYRFTDRLLFISNRICHQSPNLKGNYLRYVEDLEEYEEEEDEEEEEELEELEEEEMMETLDDGGPVVPQAVSMAQQVLMPITKRNVS